MSLWSAAVEHWVAWLVWGLVASAAMATLLEGAMQAGLSRMSLPFLFGTVLVEDRRRAILIGYLLYLLGGWAFGGLYALVLVTFPFGSLWTAAGVGGAMGFAHGAFLIAVVLPLMPFVHPRLAGGGDGPRALSRIERPGPFGLNYGRSTPAVTVLAQTVYGLIFGAGFGAALTG